MGLSNQEIRQLRQRLGWSVAEMARQMGCTTDLIMQWESGAVEPAPESLNQLQYLQTHVEENCEHVAQTPLVETRMQDRQLSQCTHRDLLKDN